MNDSPGTINITSAIPIAFRQCATANLHPLMHNCIMGFYIHYQANTGAFPHKYRSVDLVDGRPPLSERMEFADNQDPFRGAITNLLIVRGMGSPKYLLCNIHKMTATKSDATFHNIHCLHGFTITSSFMTSITTN